MSVPPKPLEPLEEIAVITAEIAKKRAKLLEVTEGIEASIVGLEATIAMAKTHLQEMRDDVEARTKQGEKFEGFLINDEVNKLIDKIYKLPFDKNYEGRRKKLIGKLMGYSKQSSYEDTNNFVRAVEGVRDFNNAIVKKEKKVKDLKESTPEQIALRTGIKVLEAELRKKVGELSPVLKLEYKLGLIKEIDQHEQEELEKIIYALTALKNDRTTAKGLWIINPNRAMNIEAMLKEKKVSLLKHHALLHQEAEDLEAQKLKLSTSEKKPSNLKRK